MQTLSKTNCFKGIITAIVTPFNQSLAVDYLVFEQLLKQQLDAKVQGIVIGGTTGESPTLKSDEKFRLNEIAMKHLKNRCLVIAGTGSNDTQKTIENTLVAHKQGVDACLIVTPYYNKPTQPGLIEHYLKIADSSDAKIILYNVPGRTGVSLSAKTIAALAQHPNIVGVKEATGNLNFFTEIKLALKPTPAAENFALLSGDDPTFWPFLMLGGDGIISVASNVIPKAMVEFYNCFCKSDFLKGLNLHESLFVFMNQLFLESNPIPVKTLMAYQKLIPLYFRQPLIKMTEENFKLLLNTFQSLPAILRE